VAVSDVHGGIYHPEGLVPRLVREHRDRTGSVVGYPGARTLTNAELLELHCELLVPAAIENQITRHNAPAVKAKVVVEGANGPHHAAGRRDPAAAGGVRGPRHPGQRGRGGGELLRVGAGPVRVLLAGGPSAHPPGGQDASGLPGRAGAVHPSGAGPAHGGPTVSGSSGSWRPDGCGVCMPEQTSALVPTRVTVDTVRHDPEVAAYVERANESLGVLGYTEHGVRHASLTSRIAYNILRRLGYPERECELAAIAAYLHDIGNLVSRLNHEHTGALLAGAILQRLGMDPRGAGGGDERHREPRRVPRAARERGGSRGDPGGQVGRAPQPGPQPRPPPPSTSTTG
jgi:hypothetical protein